MKFINNFIFLLIGTTCVVSHGYAQLGQETGFDRQLRTLDDQPLRGFVDSKEDISVQIKAKNLDISGDVRFFWQNLQEKGDSLYASSSSDYSGSDSFDFRDNYRAFRGGHHVDGANIPLSTNIFDVEFNLKVKYTFKDAWAMAHVQFDNPAGSRASLFCREDFPVFNKDGSVVEDRISKNTKRGLKGSGIGAGINLRRAYIGYNLYADGVNRVDVELGRRKMDDIFESEIQFSNRFDGLLLKYTTAFDNLFDFYWNIGGFVIDQRVNHFGYVTELGLVDICDMDLAIYYSFIDWRKHGENRCFNRNPLGANFANSQISFSYTIKPFSGFLEETPFELYGGFLINHAAKKTKFSKFKKENLGWYAGLFVGNVEKKGDWAFDFEYVCVQAQAVPDADVASIARGNIFNENFFDVIPLGTDSYSGYYLPRRGNGNFYGFRFNFLYGLTDNLTADFVYQWSHADNANLGGRHHYQDFELEIIYAF